MILLALPIAVLHAGDLRLIEAVKNTDAKAVRSLLQQHVDVNAAEADGFTALHWAAQRDNLEIADLLLSDGANVKAASRYNITPLSLACTNGDAAIIDRFLKAGADPNATSEQGQTALMTAALTGKVDAVKLLLAHGANVNAKEPWKGQTALMWAASEGNADAAGMLIEFGADVNAKSNSGFTPLLFAVRNGHIDAAKVLLAHGANVNDVAPDGTSALGMAVINAYYELAVVLLDHGANPNAPDPRGSVLHTLAWMRRPGSSPSAGAGGPPLARPFSRARWIAWSWPRRCWRMARIRMSASHGRKLNTIATSDRCNCRSISPSAANTSATWARRRSMSRPKVAMPIICACWRPAAQIPKSDGPKHHAVNGRGRHRLLGWREPRAVRRMSGERTAGGREDGDRTWQRHQRSRRFRRVSDGRRRPVFAAQLSAEHQQHAAQCAGRCSLVRSTALHGAVVSGQISIVKYLIDHGAQVDAKTRLGWTPLMLANGVFVSNTKKEFPEIAVLLKKEMATHGLLDAEAASTKTPVNPKASVTPAR